MAAFSFILIFICLFLADIVLGDYIDNNYSFFLKSKERYLNSLPFGSYIVYFILFRDGMLWKD